MSLISLKRTLALLVVLDLCAACGGGSASTSPATTARCPGNPSTLATHLSGPGSVVVDSEYVYWTTGGTVVHGMDTLNGSLWRASLSGCGTPEILSTDSSGQSYGALVQDASNLYWATQDHIFKLSKADTSATQVLTISPTGVNSIAVDDTTLYFSSLEDISGMGSILSMPLTGGNPVVLAPNRIRPGALAVDASNVYWTTHDQSPPPTAPLSSIESAPKGGGAVTTLASGQHAPCGVAVADGVVYWTNGGTFGVDNSNGDGTLASLPSGASTPVVLATGLSDPCALSVDAESVYWVGQADTASDGISKVARGGGSPVQLAPMLGALGGGIAVDATNAYWTTFDSVMTARK